MIKPSSQSGFTAVELLITLFVAAAFLIAGYQLFNVVIKDGGQARAESTAGNVAYDYLRRYAPQATNPCTAATVLNNAAVTIGGLSNARVTVIVSCPPGYSATGLSKVEAVITYNTPQQTSRYSTFTNGASTTPLDVTSGLVGWWKLNGDTNSSVGTAHGTITGNVMPTTGQNGLTNNSYSFSGSCCNYIRTAASSALPTTITLSAWLYPTAYPSERAAIITKDPANGVDGYYLSLNSDGSIQTYWYNASSPGYHSSGAGTVPLNQWSFVTATWDGGTVRIYVNGIIRTTVASISPPGATSANLTMGTEAAASYRQYNGRLDDIRIYNRALLGPEIQTLYNGGGR